MKTNNSPTQAAAQAPDFATLKAQAFQAAKKTLYWCRHWVKHPHGAADLHNTITNEFLQLARQLGVYCSEECAGLIVAHWVNRQHNYMRRDNLPLGMRFTNEQKDRGTKNSGISRGKTSDNNAKLTQLLRRFGRSRKQIEAILGLSISSIDKYIAKNKNKPQAKPRPPKPQAKPRLHVSTVKAVICYLWSCTPSKNSADKEPPTDSKLQPHEEIDVLTELKKHWSSQKKHISHNAPPAKPPPERKIAYQT